MEKIDVINSKKVFLQKSLSARVTQPSRFNLIFDLIFALCLYISLGCKMYIVHDLLIYGLCCREDNLFYILKYNYFKGKFLNNCNQNIFIKCSSNFKAVFNINIIFFIDNICVLNLSIIKPTTSFTVAGNQRKLDSVNSVQLSWQSHPLWVSPVVITNNRKQFEIPNTKFEIENRIFVS